MQRPSDWLSLLSVHFLRARQILSTRVLLPALFAAGAAGASGSTLAFDPAGNLYAVQKHAICKFTADGTRSTLATGFKSPIALCLDSKGNLFVADYQEQRIYKLTPYGKKIIFQDGITSGGMAVDRSDNLFVTQVEGPILKFTPEGEKSTLTSGIGNLGSPMDLALDRDGNLFVVPVRDLDATTVIPSAIIKLSPDGGTKTVFASSLNEPAGISLDKSGNLFVTEATQDKRTYYIGRTILRFDPDGTKNTFASDLPGRPASLACNSSDEVFVSSENSILEFDSKGTRRTFTSDRLSPDKQWEYQGDESSAEIVKAGADKTALDLRSEIGNAYELDSANVVWAPNSERFAFNYYMPAPHARYESIALYQLRNGKWEALPSPVNPDSRVSQLKQLSKGQPLPKSRSRGRGDDDVLRALKWIDSDTLLLYAGSPKVVLLFTLKLDAKGNSKITKIQPVSDEELDEMDD